MKPMNQMKLVKLRNQMQLVGQEKIVNLVELVNLVTILISVILSGGDSDDVQSYCRSQNLNLMYFRLKYE